MSFNPEKVERFFTPDQQRPDGSYPEDLKLQRVSASDYDQLFELYREEVEDTPKVRSIR